jgi:hypothetical protein
MSRQLGNSLKVFGYVIKAMKVFLENTKNNIFQHSDTEKGIDILKNSAILLF